jgi:hypothetical protein
MVAKNYACPDCGFLNLAEVAPGTSRELACRGCYWEQWGLADSGDRDADDNPVMVQTRTPHGRIFSVSEPDA